MRLEANRNRPYLLTISFHARAQEESLLPDRYAPALYFGEIQYRLARLRDEALHNFVYRLMAYFRLSVPEVFRRGIAVNMSVQIVVNSLAKGLFAEIVLHHQQ